MQRLDPAGVLAAMASDPARAHVVAAHQVLAVTEVSDPVLHRLYHAASLMRTFDRDLLTRLVASPDYEPDDLAAGLDRLLDSPMVHSVRAGTWSLDPAIRAEFVSHRLSRGEEAPLEEDRTRLAELLDERYRHARRAAVAFSDIDDVVHGVDVERHAQLADVVEDVLIRTAIDSVYAARQLSLEQGVHRLGDTFEDLANSGAHHACEILVRSWIAETGSGDQSDSALHEAWGQYYLARGANLTGNPHRALDALDDVAAPETLDLRYATWHASERSNALWQLSRFDEAQQSLDREIAIHQEHHPDDGNFVTAWTGKATMSGQLWRHRDQVEAARKAVDAADQYASIQWRAQSRFVLAQAERAIGDPDGAVLDTIRGFALARQAVTEELSPHTLIVSRGAADNGVRILGPLSPRLLAVLAEQHRQLMISRGPQGQLDALLARAEALTSGGAGAAASETFAAARELATSRVPERLRDVDAEEAGWGAELGRPREGAMLNVQLATRNSSADPWERGRYATNAALGFLMSGSYAEAEEQVDRAHQVWSDIGHEVAVRYVAALRAEIHRRQGKLDSARQLLDSSAGLSGAPEGAWLEFTARVQADLGDYAAAGETALRATQTARLTGEAGSALERALLAVNYLGHGTDPGAGEAPLDAARELLAARRDFVAWEPTEDGALADQHAARAVRILVDGFGTFAKRVASAQQHLEMAIHLDDSVAWFWLEASFVEAAHGRGKGARDRLAGAIDRAVGTPALQRALTAFRTERAE